MSLYITHTKAVEIAKDELSASLPLHPFLTPKAIREEITPWLLVRTSSVPILDHASRCRSKVVCPVGLDAPTASIRILVHSMALSIRKAYRARTVGVTISCTMRIDGSWRCSGNAYVKHIGYAGLIRDLRIRARHIANLFQLAPEDGLHEALLADFSILPLSSRYLTEVEGGHCRVRGGGGNEAKRGQGLSSGKEGEFQVFVLELPVSTHRASVKRMNGYKEHSGIPLALQRLVSWPVVPFTLPHHSSHRPRRPVA